MHEAIVLTVFPLIVAVAAVSDLLTMRIPNRISVILAVSFFVLAPIIGLGWADIGWHLLAGLVMFVICFVCFALNLFGGGDAKLAPAISLWLGWSLVLHYALVATLLGGVLALLLLKYRSKPASAFVLGHDWLWRLHGSKKDMPYGIALAAAGLILYLETPWFESLY